MRKGVNAFGGKNITPQRTLDGKVIAIVGNPKQVYQALGMSRNATTVVQKRWNRQFREPIHEMSPSNRSRAVSMTTEVLEKVLRAFAGDNWEALLYYISKNVFLHNGPREGRHNSKDRQDKHRDEVYQQTLVRSTLVKHVVDSFNQIEGNTRRANDERRRVLSLIACDFPFQILQRLSWRLPDVGSRYKRQMGKKYKGRVLTRHMFRDARAHAGAFTPGGHPINIPHRKKVSISADTIKRVYSYIMSGDHVQKLAEGTNDLVLSTGEMFTIPPVARKFLRTHMWANFTRNHKDDNGVYNGGVSRTYCIAIVYLHYLHQGSSGDQR